MAGSAGTTNTACAACKYQRRKCTADCPLSPYFPPDQPKRFQNVHKLFGVSNILRILKHVEPSKREDTVKSIAYEADTREKDPVHGCLGVITILQNQVSKLKDELAVARDQLYVLQHQSSFHQQQAQMQQIVGSLGGSTSVVNVSTPQETSVLMQHLQQYNHDIHNQLGAEFAKSSSLPIASFEPDHYLRNDNFDMKPASTSRFDVGRYIRGESPVQHLHQHQPQHHQHGHQGQQLQQGQHQQHGQHQQVQQQQQQQGQGQAQEGALVKPEQTEHHHHQQQQQQQQQQRSMHLPFGSVTDSGASTFSDTSGEHDAFDTSGRYAMAIRRRGSGLLNLTVASDAELRRASHVGHHGVPEQELRSAGVYLTLTNN